MAFTRVSGGAGSGTPGSALAPFLNRAYATGFGATALQKARNSGLSDNQIKSALANAGLQIGPKAALSLGANPTMHQYTQPGSYGFGAGALAAAQAAGMTNAEIRSNLATSGLTIGDKAAEALNVNPGFTYAGYAPSVRQDGYAGNSGTQYPLRPQLAPRGYGMDGRFSSSLGYSPTLYIAGGENDYDALNTVFGLNYDGGPNIGGGYYDPDFNQREFVPASSFGIGGMDPAMMAFNAIMQRYNMDNATTNQAAAPAPQASFGSAGSTSNTASGVRTAGTPGSGTTYNTMNRAGSTGMTIGGLNMN
jgi:hypothetical protein